MIRTRSLSVVVTLVLVCGLVAVAAPAGAQYRPLPNTKSGSGSGSAPKGEPYHVEFAFNLWDPVPQFVIASESLGIPGTDIDVQAELAIEQKQMYEMRVVLRPGKKHKFRFQYLPLAYEGQTTLSTEIIFNGIKFPVSAEVATELKWNTYRIGYEYDFVSNDKGYFGMILEAKYTDAQFQLRTPISTEYVRARAPIPAIGATGRVYIAKYGSITGEFTAFKLPENIDQLKYQAHYFDWDVYGTVNITDNIGAQVGYRTLELGYSVDLDRGEARLKGPYFGGVVRF
ncbi:MAG: hypothetical protein NTY02_01550 [Acidobacteria bacterium]|nr:hypothetical protein [Acidobacteriota bacterium]